MRKSIFEIVAESIDIAADVDRLITMATEEQFLTVGYCKYYSLFEFIDEYCFRYWEYRGHCVDVDDYLETLDFEELQANASEDTDALMTVIEVIYNFWQLSNDMFQNKTKDLSLKWSGNYYHLKDVMDDILGRYNHTAYVNKKENCVLIVENKSEITAVAEIMPSSTLSIDVIKYNHRTLKGEVDLKKKILLDLGAQLEPKRKQLHGIDSKLEDNIFYMLNNLNIRHNNRSKDDKNYREPVARMRKDTLEKWYDELYQMMLLAFLLIDNEKRTEKVKELKTKINGGNG